MPLPSYLPSDLTAQPFAAVGCVGCTFVPPPLLTLPYGPWWDFPLLPSLPYTQVYRVLCLTLPDVCGQQQLPALP